MVVLAAQQGRCATAGCQRPARDVVLRARVYTAFCQSCRLKLDAPQRVPKAIHTKIVRRAERAGQRDLFR
jgi:hypothetical protein